MHFYRKEVYKVSKSSRPLGFKLQINHAMCERSRRKQEQEEHGVQDQDGLKNIAQERVLLCCAWSHRCNKGSDKNIKRRKRKKNVEKYKKNFVNV